jgi:hypothetical protein
VNILNPVNRKRRQVPEAAIAWEAVAILNPANLVPEEGPPAAIVWKAVVIHNLALAPQQVLAR